MLCNVACGNCKFKHSGKTNSLYRPDVFYTKICILQNVERPLKISVKEFIFVYEVACINAVKVKKK